MIKHKYETFELLRLFQCEFEKLLNMTNEGIKTCYGEIEHY